MSCLLVLRFPGLRIHSRGLLLVVHPQICGTAHDSGVCPHPLDVDAHDELNSLLRARGGLVVRHDHPELAGSFDWLLREGRLATALPGVYAAPAIAERDEDLFESDGWRQNALVADGWRVLRFTWAMLREHPDVFLSAVLDALH